MRIPTIRGLIDRRVLVNFRVDLDVLSRVCPSPFRPQAVGGFGIAGICLIRLKHIRPKRWPSFLGISSENAAHRIAVEWDIDGVTQTGVYIPRRDTSSILNAVAGGRVFPGVHHRARFMVRETDEEYHIAMDSVDGTAHVAVEGRTADGLPEHSVFASVAECSQFFEAGSLGYSPASEAAQFDGLELRAANWRVQPLAVTSVQSSFFDDQAVFPEGSVAFDNALLMRGMDHEWHHRESLCSRVLSNDTD
ncbi:hypothetical protein RISK_001470 [Rhodopirellula islandica]|uniref:DUF2071 domain-containing protein n=1 Tax=Rhodopirellula islandica TaxID=595434 RepID=A0A0J1EL37_RHOIS|nr:DUF2071 domain-containing protein [Rhodopirellula islandica]KLU06259.1 hypothetical protein RISK_001470 [Rhodopirellula islandica]